MNSKIAIIILSLIFYQTTYAQEILYLFGGKNHDTFLGTINTNSYSKTSIWNQYGEYGNNYNYESIWNEYSKFGSNYSDYSPFNTTAQYPPVIVDRWGNFYGYLTKNYAIYNRVTFDLAEEILNFR